MQSLATQNLKNQQHKSIRSNEILDFLTYKMEEIEEECSVDQSVDQATNSQKSTELFDGEFSAPQPLRNFAEIPKVSFVSEKPKLMVVEENDFVESPTTVAVSLSSMKVNHQRDYPPKMLMLKQLMKNLPSRDVTKHSRP